jgi:ATPase subunit of ABC transporter with duplicated ATPase domains
MFENKREPKIVMGARKRAAQESAGKHRIMHEERLADARTRLTEAEEAVRADTEIRIELPATRVPAGRTVLTATGLAAPEPETGTLTELIVRGPERIALTGPNGSGKTTFLRALTGERVPDGMEVKIGVEGVRYLPQRLDILDEDLSVIDNVRAQAPSASVNDIRAGLARFLFRGARAEQRAGTLSGGERFRAVLASLLLAEPDPQLLMLDEPTNNLDMASAAQLAQALAAYEGALIVVSHDVPFLRTLALTRWLRQGSTTGLTETAPM